MEVLPITSTAPTTSAAATAADDATKDDDHPHRSRGQRHRRWLVSLLIAVVVAGVVALSLTLTGAFRPAAASSSTAAQQEGGGESGAPEASVPADPLPNVTYYNNETTAPTTENNETSSSQSDQDEGLDEGQDEDNSNNSSGTQNSTASEEYTIQKWPDEPQEYLPEFELIWDPDAPTTINILDTGETVQIRWPECVGMKASECEELVRSTNPYITDIPVNGFISTAFFNNRVYITTDNNNVVNFEPRVG
jgi:hypothetical protein